MGDNRFVNTWGSKETPAIVNRNDAFEHMLIVLPAKYRTILAFACTLSLQLASERDTFSSCKKIESRGR